MTWSRALFGHIGREWRLTIGGMRTACHSGRSRHCRHLFDKPVVGLTAGECAAAWSGICRQEGILLSQNRFQVQDAFRGLRPMQLLVMFMRVCARFPVYPVQWSPSSPPPRPKARMATAGGYENVQTPLLEAGLSSMFHHRLVRPAKFRCVSLSYPRSWGRAAKKHLRYTSRESPQGKQQRDNTHSLPLTPSYNTPRPVNQYPQD
jgi:hypothetical protein